MWRQFILVAVVGCGGNKAADEAIVADQPLEIGPRDTSSAQVSAQVPIGATAQRADGGPLTRFMEYGTVIDRVTGMVSDDSLIERASGRGLDVLDLTWEDTGREMGSALGPNISDLTLQVRRKSPWVAGAYVTSLMPVLRFPNFSDKTGDVPADKFFVRVGNEKDGGDLTTIPLTDLLKNITEHASAPKSIKGSGNLLAPRDTHFLVSAQAVFLPIPRYGEAEFNPVLFNYQSAPGSPADLAILVTRQGTSIQVIENKPEDRTATGWGQELYFDNRGQRANFTAERRTEVIARIEAQGGPQSDDDRTAMSKAADVIFLIQVPLKHKNDGYLPGLSGGGSGYGYGLGLSGAGFGAGGLGAPAPTMTIPSAAPGRAGGELAQSDVDRAVVGHGPNLGPFSEGHDLELVRDPAFPIRITVQFYKATSNGVVSNADLDAIKKSVADVYSHADFVGSLVVPEGDSARPTAWEKTQGEWFPW
jgi:hypothetical protein